jgi:hypothetical protein
VRFTPHRVSWLRRVVVGLMAAMLRRWTLGVWGMGQCNERIVVSMGFPVNADDLSLDPWIDRPSAAW